MRTISIAIAVLALTLEGAGAGSFITIAPPKPGYTPSIITLGDKPPSVADAESEAPVARRAGGQAKVSSQVSIKGPRKVAKVKTPLTKTALRKTLDKKTAKGGKTIKTAVAEKGLGKKALIAEKPVRTASAGKVASRKAPTGERPTKMAAFDKGTGKKAAAIKGPAKNPGKGTAKAVAEAMDPAKPLAVKVARSDGGQGKMNRLSRSVVAVGTPDPGVTDERVAAIGKAAPAPMLIRGGLFGDSTQPASPLPTPSGKAGIGAGNPGAPPRRKTAGAMERAAGADDDSVEKTAPAPVPAATTTLR